MKPHPLIVQVPEELVLPWCNFHVNDVDLLKFYFKSDYNITACFIASLKEPREVKLMLEQLGNYMERGCNSVIFRTYNSTVMRWAVRFKAVWWCNPDHNPRFLMQRSFAPEWFELCEKAYRLSKANQGLRSAPKRSEFPAKS